ncbi:MAG: glutathione synthase [Myxococcota bacterium]|nr:glutathione synthase [Myxococcota bacterium]
MRALFVMDPLSTVNVDGDSSYVLMLEWQRRGGEVWHCGPGDLWSTGGKVFAKAAKLSVGPRPKVADLELETTLDLTTCRAVFKRTDPPFDMNYVFCTYLLDLAASQTVVCNAPQGLREANEKMVILKFPDLIPTTLVTRQIEGIRQFVADQGGRAVIKPLDGNGGRGVFVLNSSDRNLGALLEVCTDEEQRYVMVQAFLPEIAQGDKRILLVDGVPKGAFLRIPPENDHRGNMHVGALVSPCDMTERDLFICDRLAPYLRENGLIFTGIDVIGGHLTEVNVTSPTGIQECTRLYGSDIAADIVDAVLARGAD